MWFSQLRATASPPPRHMIVGLGNPGSEYAQTRHNIGFRVIEGLVRRHSLGAERSTYQARIVRGIINETAVVLVRPQTFMNLSGECVAPLMRMFGLTPDQLLVITDDLDLPTGQIRVRAVGSPGGHNGLKSLVHTLKTENFPRIRVGIGRPAPGLSVIDHVLGDFGPEELPLIETALELATDAVELIIRQGIEAGMCRYNGRTSSSGPTAE